MANIFFSVLSRPVFLIGVAALSCSCKQDSLKPPDNPCVYQGIDTCQAKKKLGLIVHLDQVKQTVHHFGASDSWTCKFIGNWADINKKNQIADLLFSMDTLSDGSPKGIGLSLWRFNIGAGSFEQGDSSDISDEWRREECFLNSDGTYNWSKQSGQQWFLQAARQRGVPYTLGFAISPPVLMTQNGKAFSPGGNALNIQAGKLPDYAGFLEQVADHFHFDYISPVNEPQWGWAAGSNGKASQEGSPALDSDISALVKLLSQKLSGAGSSSKVVIGEAGEWNFLYGSNNDGRGDQIAQFFTPSSSNYIGNLPNVVQAISSHSYFTTCPDDNMINVRTQVSAKVAQVDPSLETWETEFGILGNICNQYNGYPRDTSINYGLYVAKVIHHDLTVANVSSWEWWLAVNPYNYSDGLVYINDPTGQMNPAGSKTDGQVLTSKQLWALGNFSRFIRPGMERIGAAIEGISDPVVAAGTAMVSAYKDAAAKKLVIVIINVSSNPLSLQLTDGTNPLTIQGNQLDAYLTDATHDLKKSVVAANSIVAPPQSILTLTGTYP